MKKRATCSAVIAAAGESRRMGTEISKQFLPLCGKPILLHTLLAFEKASLVDDIIVVCRKEDVQQVRTLAQDISKLKTVIVGGKTRQISVAAGVLASDAQYVAIHDGARPLVSPEAIDMVIEDAYQFKASALCTPVKDTIKVADANSFVVSTPERAMLRAMQTPQVFLRTLYLESIEKAEKMGITSYTDDCQLVEQMGIRVHLCEEGYTNVKITTQEDLLYARSLMSEGEFSMRIGHGYDVHRLVPERKLILGGVEIPWEKGLLGHSDADVLLHAIMDALLGAAALGDIGLWFPDTDMRYKDANSLELLSTVSNLLLQRNYTISNIDATITAQKPKLRPYMEQMRENIAKVCSIPITCINIKATTEEGLGFTGREEGISATAVCLLKTE